MGRERDGLGERERQDQEKAEENRKRQIRQGVISEGGEEVEGQAQEQPQEPQEPSQESPQEPEQQQK